MDPGWLQGMIRVQEAFMRILKLTKDSKKNLLEELLKRSPNQYKEYEARVYGIIEEVRSKGDAALFSYTEQFDGAVLDRGTIQVTMV